MSSNTETENPINWIEDAISKRHIKHYEYEHFSNIQEIGTGGFGKVYRANWKNLRQHFALKSLLNINDVAIKELVHEVITRIYLHTTKLFICISGLKVILYTIYLD